MQTNKQNKQKASFPEIPIRKPTTYPYQENKHAHISNDESLKQNLDRV